MLKETPEREKAQVEVLTLLNALPDGASFYEEDVPDFFIEKNQKNMRKLDALAEKLTQNGMHDIALEGYAALYVSRFDQVLRKALEFIPEDQAKPFEETMRAGIIDGALKVAPKAIALNPVASAIAIGRMLTATVLIDRQKVTEDGGFTSLRLNSLNEQFHRSVREIARNFNKGGKDLINPFLGELRLRCEEDYRSLTFPHKRATTSVILAHGGNSGTFLDAKWSLLSEDRTTKTQARTVDYFAERPDHMPNDGRRYVPVQGLLFGSGG